MSKRSSQTILPLNNQAEGRPDDYERLEPANPERILPERKGQKPRPYAGDTGINRAVRMQSEGEDNKEMQDASLTRSESQITQESVPQADSISSVQNGDPRPLLIVEDTVELAEVLQATLEGMGLHAEYATHGKTGLERMRAINPQIILLDIGLPDISGWKMLDGIKEHYADLDDEMPRIIIITAYGDPANRLIGKLQNIFTYLIKPFTPDQVEEIVKRALKGRQSGDSTHGA